MRALDLFAGAGGWDVAARELGIECDGVEIMPEARATRAANGLTTSPYHDVWAAAEIAAQCHWRLPYEGLIASPPCQTFSMAGKGAGRKALDLVLGAIDAEAWKDVDRLRRFGDNVGDERTALVLVPLLYWHHMRPRWVAFEQVPTVLPVWGAMADVMRQAGYSVWTGNLHAEQYGVPQTRKRAILMARRWTDPIPGRNASRWLGTVKPPTPTHSKYYPRDKTRLDPGVKPWVSMADGLGLDAPYVQHRVIGRGREERHGKPADRTTDNPSYTMRGNASASARGGGYVLEPVFPDDGPELFGWVSESPSPTLVGSFRPDVVAARGYRKPGDPPRQKTPGSVQITLEQALRLQGFPDGFEVCGGEGARWLQMGNAICPPLAKAILEALVGDQAVTIDPAMEAAA